MCKCSPYVRTPWCEWCSSSVFSIEQPIIKTLENLNLEIEKAILLYFQYKYGITSKEIENIIKNVNNFRFKEKKFYKVVQGKEEYYFDEDYKFLYVNTESFEIRKLYND